MNAIDTTQTQEWLPLLNQLADIADDIATHYFKAATLKVDHKPDKTVVTQADIEIEAKIRDVVRHSHPELGIYGEEHGQCAIDHPLKLIIDPIDGTTNFMRRIPFYAALLAIEVNGTVVAGLVSAGQTQDRWWASRQNGAFHNGRQLQVSTFDQISDSQIAHGSIAGPEANGAPESLVKLIQSFKRQRGFGDYLSPMMVAMGCAEVCIDFNLKPWDLAPLGIIIEEAGGQVSTVSGDPFSIYQPTILGSNGPLHQDALSLIS